jgi:hypothetical protein
MKTSFHFKTLFFILLQGIGGMVAFLASLILANMLLPLSAAITANAPASGFLPAPLAFLLNGAVNAALLVWAARRSSLKGLPLVGQLLVLSFGAQVFMTQIETAYFISAFPLLQNNFEVYVLIARGFVTSLFFSLLVAWITGGLSKSPRSMSAFTVTVDNAVKHGAWLAFVYFILYALAGYYIAWQIKDLRLFYNGPAELNSFFAQWGLSLMQRPELPVFQYFRGILWLLCLVPLFRGFTGRRTELLVFSALALGLLPTVQLAFANPLMPAAVSLGHFWEVALSTGIFGALCAWFIAQPQQAK